MALQHALDDGVAVDRVADRLADLFLVERRRQRAHGDEHRLDGVAHDDLGSGVLLNAIDHVRRDELGDLHLAVEQRSDALLRLAHDLEDEFVRIVRRDLRIVRVFLQHEIIVDHELLQLVGTDAEGILVRVAAVRVPLRLRHHDDEGQVVRQRRRGLLGLEHDGARIADQNLGDLRDIIGLPRLRISLDAVDGVDEVLGDHRLAVVALEAGFDGENPGLRVFDLPALEYVGDVVLLLVVVPLMQP